MAFLRFRSLLICSVLLCGTALALEHGPGKELVLSLGGEVSVINPILSTDTASSAVENLIFSGLTRVNEDLEVVPDMAGSWRVSRDGRIYTFRLRKGIKWHDGRELTSEDVKFTFDSILDPRVNSVRRSDYIIDGVPIRFETPDRYTVRAVLPKPFAPFMVRMGMGIIPKHIFSGEDINTSPFNRNPVGSGPFRFVEWKTGDHIRVRRNDDYYMAKPLLGSILLRIIPDENATLMALEAREIDSAGIPAKDYTRMSRVKGLNIFEYDALTYTYLGLNNDNPLFSDRKVRQAMAYAVNKRQLINLVMKRRGSKAYSPSSPVSWAYSDDVFKFEHDLKRSKEMLDGMGWETGRDGYRYRDGRRFEFTCLVNQGNKEREKAAVILQHQFKRAGIKMNIRVLEWAAMLRIVNDPNPPKKFDAVVMGWSLGLDPDGYSIWHSSQYPKGFNFIKYENPEVDRLLEAGRTEMNRGRRKAIYARINRIISGDQPYIFLWYPRSVIGVRERVKGLSRPGPAGLFLNIERVYIEE